jgi:hypothetical protein
LKLANEREVGAFLFWFTTPHWISDSLKGVYNWDDFHHMDEETIFKKVLGIDYVPPYLRV